ncbi:MAG: radical SAM protein, partial [Candidatus Thorarchaeota archaeon]
ILQATVGCSHNACTFCVSYKKKKYKVRGAKGIKEDLANISPQIKESVSRVFLGDGNALAVDSDELTRVLEVLRDELPSLSRVGVYGYAKDVRSKTVEDLQQLHEQGLGIVYLGLETGDDKLLQWVRKGVDSQENISACARIREAGIPLSLTIILGLGGSENSHRHAVATARALNEIDPEFVGALTLMIPQGTPMFDMVQKEQFSSMEPIEILQELETLVENLDLSRCIFRTNHASNYLPIGGTLNEDKERILSVLRKVIEDRDESVLRPQYSRGL